MKAIEITDWAATQNNNWPARRTFALEGPRQDVYRKGRQGWMVKSFGCSRYSRIDRADVPKAILEVAQ